jgi:Na+/proline symporter
MYVAKHGLPLPEKADYLYPTLAFEHFGTVVGMAVLIGLIASALNAADGTLTALSTSISVDFLGINPDSESPKSLNLVRNLQLGMGGVLLGMMIIFYILGQSQWKGLNVISLVLSMAGYTYGPLLGLYAWGMLTKIKVRDGWVTGVALLSPVICILLKMNEEAIFGIKLGYELLLINGGITFAGIALGRIIKGSFS